MTQQQLAHVGKFQLVALHCAARSGLFNLFVTTYRKCPQSVIKKISYGATVMDEAIEGGGNVAVVKFLTDHHPELVVKNDENDDKKQPFVKAALGGRLEMLEYFADFVPETLTRYGAAALCNGVGHLNIVTALVKRKVDLLTTPYGKSGTIALIESAKSKDMEVVKYLLKMCPQSALYQDKDGNTALHHAISARSSRYEIALHLAENAPDSIVVRNLNGATPAFEAATTGASSLLECFLKMRPQALDIANNDGETLLFAAATKGYMNVVEFLVERYHMNIGDIETKTFKNAILSAAHNGKLAVVQYLANACPKAALTSDSSGRNALILACCKRKYADWKNVGVVKFLAEKFPQLLLQFDRNHKTALWHAAASNDLEICEVLSNYEPKLPKIACSMGVTPLGAAAINGHSSVVDLLKDDNAPDDSALYLALLFEQFQIAKTLAPTLQLDTFDERFEVLQRIAMNYPKTLLLAGNIDGLTCLHVAVERGLMQLCKYACKMLPELVQNSANDDKATPVWLAAKRNKFDIFCVLAELWPEGLMVACGYAKNTPVFEAVQWRNVSIVEYISKVCPQSFKKDPERPQKCLLYEAAKTGDLKLVQIVADTCPELLDQPTEGYLGNALAAALDNIEIVDFLTDRKPELLTTPTSSMKRVPVTIAVARTLKECKFDVIKLLVERCPEALSMAGRDGKNAFVLAEENGRREVLTLLEKYRQS